MKISEALPCFLEYYSLPTSYLSSSENSYVLICYCCIHIGFILSLKA